MSMKTFGAALALTAAAATVQAGPVLDAVKARGEVICGVNTAAPGFSAVDSQGNSAAPAAEEPAAEEPAAEGEAEAAEAEPEAEPAPETPHRTVARDKLTIWGETFVPYVSEYEGGNDVIYVYGRVENTSDKPVNVTNPKFELYNASDDLIASEEYINCEPSILQPGESTYISKSMWLESGVSANDVADYVLDLNISNDLYYTVTRFPVEVEYVENDPRNGGYPKMYATVTNDTDETVFDMRVTGAILGETGEVLYVVNNYSDIGILPGSAAIFPLYVDQNVLKTLAAKDIKPASFDAIAFTEVYNY